MKAIHGGKAKSDKIDSEKIARMLRGRMLPQAYVYPKEMRATRDRAPTHFALVAAADEVGQAARPGDRACGVWPIRLRDGLPSIPVPLRAPDPDARLDLQTVLHTIYDRAGYRHRIYRGTPSQRCLPMTLNGQKPF